MDYNSTTHSLAHSHSIIRSGAASPRYFRNSSAGVGHFRNSSTGVAEVPGAGCARLGKGWVISDQGNSRHSTYKVKIFKISLRLVHELCATMGVSRVNLPNLTLQYEGSAV